MKKTYYLIKERILGKREEDEEIRDYLFLNGAWMPDYRMKIFSYLMGFDPSEPEDSPYAVGNSDIMDDIEEISEERAVGLVTQWAISSFYAKG